MSMENLFKHLSYGLKKTSLFLCMTVAGVLTASADNTTNSVTESQSVQQARSIRGHVVDENGEPMIGVTVVIKGVTGGAITDLNGNFTISVPSGRNTLELSYTGYKSQSVSISGNNNVNITMEPDMMGLDDVVVIGYGTMKKRDLTGSVSSVKSDEIIKTPTVNVMEAIQGQVAGFDIVRTMGELGDHTSLTLRGNRSIYGNNDPLFIIDGMEGSFDAVNPNDIESVEVLKDASSTAIYGAAGANGVVIITTKNPQKGKFSVNLDAYYGVNKATSFPKLNTGNDYINFRREAAKTVGKWSSPADDESIWPSYMWPLIQNNQWVDWFDLATQTGTTQNYNLSTTYSNDKVSSYISLGFNDTEGILPGEQMKRYSGRAKVDFTPNRYVGYGFNLYALYQDYDHMYGRVWNRIICTPPLGTPYDEDGKMVLFPVGGDRSNQNPLADMNPGQWVNNTKTLTVMPQAYVEVKPLQGLSFKSILGGTLSSRDSGMFIGNESFNGLATGSEARKSNTFTYNYQWQNIITYNFKVADIHEFTLTGISDWQKNRRQFGQGYAYNFDETSYQYHNLGAGTGTPKVESNYVQSQTMSYAARLNYSLLGRYLFTLSGRWDGSSMLAEGKKWDFFPAAAFAWRVSDEAFMESTKDWLSNLKFRLSYGVTGNAGAAEYATLDYSRTGNIGFQDISVPYSGFSQYIANLDLGWEKSTMIDVGLDIGLFNGRVEIVADWYKTKTKDLLFERSLPYATGGYGSSTFKIWTNIGETENTGFELAINSRNIVTKNFTWSTAFTFATNKEKVVKTTSENPLQLNDYYLVIGEPVHTYYMYKYDGIWGTAQEAEAAKYGAKPGQIRVVDVDGNEKIDANDYQVIGHDTPDWTASMTNTFNIYDFDLSFQLISRWGQIFRNGLTGWYRLDGLTPQPTVCDYWTPENQGARYPQPNMNSSQDTYQGNGTSSLNYFDGSYIKVRNITLGYTLPKKLVKQVRIQNARVYATVSNPFIWAKDSYLKDYDLEKGGDDDNAPLTKQFVFGINVTF